ncbi:hypothetical protein C453_11976 [Haloferax elongans ATCC BAA-1513]|uniref:Lipoprotein n=1 Tax=Haloferax elongans ATCC BAA-1513 TaxID=1230453 RepID=M0HLZ1_HALEO|nr:hypothetical protein [Haloferax elongans]ELZ84732.1 hypothetical protein C453_11976 [Haloferax elongans ATCC BAA-1513]
MNRRTFLSGVSSGLVAASGCLGSGTSTPIVTDREVTVVERGCGERQNTASLDYDRSIDQLRLEGVVSGTTNCGGLDISYTNNESSDRVIVEVIATDSADCPSCTRYYDYEATVSFRETPSVVVVFHSDPELLGDGWTVLLDESSTTTETA